MDGTVLRDALNMVALNLETLKAQSCQALGTFALSIKYPHTQQGSVITTGIISYMYSTGNVLVRIVDENIENNTIVREKKWIIGNLETDNTSGLWFKGPVRVGYENKVVSAARVSINGTGELVFYGQGGISVSDNSSHQEIREIIVRGEWGVRNERNCFIGPTHTSVLSDKVLQFERIKPSYHRDTEIRRYHSGRPENRKMVVVTGIKDLSSPSTLTITRVKYSDKSLGVTAEAMSAIEIGGSPILLGQGSLILIKQSQALIGNWNYYEKENRNVFVTHLPIGLPNGSIVTGESHWDKEGTLLGRFGNGSIVTSQREEIQGQWQGSQLLSPNSFRRVNGVTSMGSAVWGSDGEFKRFTGNGRMQIPNQDVVIGNWDESSHYLVGNGSVEMPSGERYKGLLSLTTSGLLAQISGPGEVLYPDKSSVRGAWTYNELHRTGGYRLTGPGHVYISSTETHYTGVLFHRKNDRYGLSGNGSILNAKGTVIDTGSFWYDQVTKEQTFTSSRFDQRFPCTIPSFSSWILKN